LAYEILRLKENKKIIEIIFPLLYSGIKLSKKIFLSTYFLKKGGEGES